jgi:hypothetical protein
LIVGSKASCRWDKRIARRRDHQAKQQADNEAIQQAVRQAMVDSGATSHFVQSDKGLKPKGPSEAIIVAANGAPMTSTQIVELPIPNLSSQATQATVVPALNHPALLSVRQLADNGYTTIFHPHSQGVTVHDVDSFKLATSKPALLQGWREAGGLWTVPIASDAAISPSLNVTSLQ